MPGPVAAVLAKVGALEALHPKLFAGILIAGALLLIASGLGGEGEGPAPHQAGPGLHDPRQAT